MSRVDSEEGPITKKRYFGFTGISTLDLEEETPMTKKSCFGVYVELGCKYNHPANYKGFSKDAGPPAGGPNNTNQINFGTCVRINYYEPSPDGLTKRGMNVSKAVGHFLEKSVGSDLGFKNNNSEELDQPSQE